MTGLTERSGTSLGLSSHAKRSLIPAGRTTDLQSCDRTIGILEYWSRPVAASVVVCATGYPHSILYTSLCPHATCSAARHLRTNPARDPASVSRRPIRLFQAFPARAPPLQPPAAPRGQIRRSIEAKLLPPKLPGFNTLQQEQLRCKLRASHLLTGSPSVRSSLARSSLWPRQPSPRYTTRPDRPRRRAHQPRLSQAPSAHIPVIMSFPRMSNRNWHSPPHSPRWAD